MSFCCGADEELYAVLLERFEAVPVKIKYVGDRDEVVIAATGDVVKRLGVVEVPRDVADANVASGEFERVAAAKEKN